jgi:hypothetical protein
VLIICLQKPQKGAMAHRLYPSSPQEPSHFRKAQELWEVTKFFRDNQVEPNHLKSFFAFATSGGQNEAFLPMGG